jgi:hypothetical protein
VEVRWFRQGFDDFETPSMLQRGNTRTRIGHLRGIDLGHDYPRLGAAFCNDAPPWVNDQ